MTIKNTINRKRLCDIDLDAPVAPKAWKNLFFAKDGRSFLGPLIFSTQKKAAEAVAIARPHIQRYDDEFCPMANTIRPDLTTDYNPKFDWWPHEHSHTLQLPWDL
jgi:hypothetical protein